MTTLERQEKVTNWLKTVKPGDEVCVTNVYNVRAFINRMFDASIPDSNLKRDINLDPNNDPNIAIITTIRGVLPDGCIVVDDKIYDQDGKPLSRASEWGKGPELQPVDDNLRDKAQRYGFINNIGKIDWNKLSTEAMNKITEIIIEEANRIRNEEGKTNENDG